MLKTLELNDARKGKRVGLRCPNGRLILYRRGTDTAIYKHLAKGNAPVLKERANRDMEMFANNGLITLRVAYRYLEEDEHLTWPWTYDASAEA